MGQQKKVFAVSPGDGVPSEINNEIKSRLLQKPAQKDEKVGETNMSPTSPSQIIKPTHGEASNEDLLSSEIGGNTFLRNSQINHETEDGYSGDFQMPSIEAQLRIQQQQTMQGTDTAETQARKLLSINSLNKLRQERNENMKRKHLIQTEIAKQMNKSVSIEKVILTKQERSKQHYSHIYQTDIN